MTEPTKIYTAVELAALLKQHPKTVQRKARASIYPHTKLGNEYRFTPEDYQAILVAGKPQESTKAARRALRLKMNSLNR